MTIILRRRRLGRTSCREIAALSQEGIVAKRNDLIKPKDYEGHNLLIRWGCTANVPIRNVLNTAEAIHEVNDKLGFRRKLNDAELCPATWFSHNDLLGNNLFDYSLVEWPVVVRPARHAQGRNLNVCHEARVLRMVLEQYPEGGYYISELINKVAEYRVFVVQGRVACVAKKTPGNPEDVAWNVARGGRFDNVKWDKWPLKAVRYAVEAFNLSKLDFGGVDVMVDGEGNCYVLEINSAPSLTSPYRQQCMAKCFDWIVRNGKERIPMKQARGGYKKFIHPAIWADAELVED